MAISLVFHAVVFLAVGLIAAPKVTSRFAPDNPPVNIVLLPRLPQDRVHRARPQSAPAAAPALGQVRPLAIHTPKDVRPDAPPSPLAAPPAPPGPAGQPNGIGTSHAPGPLPYEDSATGVRAFLRGSVGCDYGETAHLTAEEKQRCANRFANMEKKAPEFSAIPGDKLGGFMAEAAANARKQQYREGTGPHTIVPCEGPGSNFGVGCLPAEAIHHFKN